MNSTNTCGCPDRSYALIDARLIEDTRFLTRFVEPPVLKRRQAVVKPGQMYGSVLREAPGDWKMWYLNGRPAQPGMCDIVFRECYAVSPDGIAWEKPALNLIPAPDGLTPNNAIMDRYYRDADGADVSGYGGPECFCVIDNRITPHPAARGRYTAFFRASPCDRYGGNCAAYSEDGLRWTAYPENPIVEGISDNTPCVFWDPRIGKYVMYGRMRGIVAGLEDNATRKIARQTSDDLAHWSTPRIVLDTDDLDAPPIPTFAEAFVDGKPHARGRDKQFYMFSAWPEHDVTMGLAPIFHTAPGTLHIELMHSYDGIDWRRELARPLYIADGRPEGLRGKMFIPALSPPVLEGDEQFLYVSQTPVPHYAEHIQDEALVKATEIMLLALKRDRWVGYAAGEIAGEIVSTPLPWEFGRLTINARIERGGYAHVTFDDELGFPLRGYDLDVERPLEGPLDAVDLPLTFGPEADAGPKRILKFPTRGPVRLRIKLKKAALFGWAFRPR
jgi:hypothetical protein